VNRVRVHDFRMKKKSTGIMFGLHARRERLKAQKAGNPPPNATRSLKRRRLSVRLSLCLLSKTMPKSKRRRCEAERRRPHWKKPCGACVSEVCCWRKPHSICFNFTASAPASRFSCYPWDKLPALALANSH
jgi:hypothetical protein